MLRSLKKIFINSLYVAIFFSGSDFNQVSARVADSRAGGNAAGMRTDRGDRYRGHGDYYSHDYHDYHDGWRDRDHWRGGYYGGYYYGGPGFYYGDGTPGYNINIYTTPDSSNNYDGSYAPYPQTMDDNAPYYQQAGSASDGSYSQPMNTDAPNQPLIVPNNPTNPQPIPPAGAPQQG